MGPGLPCRLQGTVRQLGDDPGVGHPPTEATCFDGPGQVGRRGTRAERGVRADRAGVDPEGVGNLQTGQGAVTTGRSSVRARNVSGTAGCWTVTPLRWLRSLPVRTRCTMSSTPWMGMPSTASAL